MGKETNRTIALALVCAGAGLATATWVARGQTDASQIELTGERLRSLRSMHTRHLLGAMGTLQAGAEALAGEEAVGELVERGEAGSLPMLESAARSLGAQSGVIVTSDGAVLAGGEGHGKVARGVLAKGIDEFLEGDQMEAYFTDFAREGSGAEDVHGYFLARIFPPGTDLSTASPDATSALLGLEISTDRLNWLLTGDGRWAEEGLGESGEVYLVGEDHLMRSESRFLAQDRDAYAAALVRARTPEPRIQEILESGSSVLRQRVESTGVALALDGVTDARVIEDYRGVTVLSAFAPLEFGGQRYALLAEMDVAEIRQAGNRIAKEVLLPSALLLSLLGIGAWLIGRARTMRFRSLRSTAFQIAGACGLSASAPDVVDDEIAACEVGLDALAGSVDELVRRHKFLRAVLDADPAPVLVARYPAQAGRDGRDDPRLIEASLEAQRVTGLEPAEIARARLSDVILHDRRQDVREGEDDHWLDQLRSDGQVQGAKVQLRQEDRPPLQATLTGTVHTEGPEDDWFIVLVATVLSE